MNIAIVIIIMKKELKLYRPDIDSVVEVPYAESSVHAGFPSPADDFMEGQLDLNIDGEFTLKRIKMESEKILLVPANPKYKTIEITPNNEFVIWGVVNWVLKNV